MIVTGSSRTAGRRRYVCAPVLLLSGLSLKVELFRGQGSRKRAHCTRWSQYIQLAASPQHVQSIFAPYMSEPNRASRNEPALEGKITKDSPEISQRDVALVLPTCRSNSPNPPKTLNYSAPSERRAQSSARMPRKIWQSDRGSAPAYSNTQRLIEVLEGIRSR